MPLKFECVQWSSVYVQNRVIMSLRQVMKLVMQANGHFGAHYIAFNRHMFYSNLFGFM